MKQEIVSAPILVYYNPREQTVLQNDASIKGLGTCLLQEEKPVYFASKALTDTQWGYVVIELELPTVACAIYTRNDQSTCRLLVPIRWSKGHFKVP